MHHFQFTHQNFARVGDCYVKAAGDKLACVEVQSLAYFWIQKAKTPDGKLIRNAKELRRYYLRECGVKRPLK